jgi:hypothetical protein
MLITNTIALSLIHVPYSSTHSWNSPAVLGCEQLYTDAHCHGGTLRQMSALHAFCSEWPYAVFSVSQMKPRFHRLLLLRSHREFRRHVCGIAPKTQSGSNSLHFVLTSKPKQERKNGIRSRGMRPQLRSKRKFNKTLGKRAAEISSGLQAIKEWKLWTGRPPPKRKTEQ